MTENKDPWEIATWEGSRREQLRRSLQLTLRERIEAIDNMQVVSDALALSRDKGRIASPATAGQQASTDTLVVQEESPVYRANGNINLITLNGCTPTPLANYLKALGVMRLLSVCDPQLRGFWRRDRFVLRTALNREAIQHFFLHEYAPTPIISPWSGRAGFLEGDDGQDSKRKGAIILRRIENAAGKRFKSYRRVVSAIRNVSVIQQLDQARTDRKRLEELKKAKKLDQTVTKQLAEIKHQETELKSALLRALRNELDDAILPWIDACFALVGDDRTPGPILGSGGNEGSMDFSINHVSYLLELINENTDCPTSQAALLLSNSLFADTSPSEYSSNIGFLDTFATGGANMSVGFEDGASGNIWDSVLAIEGTLLFASLTTKRLESTTSGRPSFPFAVTPSLAGSGSLAMKESARSELWLPLWEGAAKLSEVIALLAEGRVTKGSRNAHSGIDMLQALSSLGAERGISAFNRFGFYERRGKGYYVATHLGRFVPPKVAHENWIMTNLNRNGWLDAFRKFVQDDNIANRYPVLRKRLEDRIFALSGREPSKAETQSLLVLLGEIQTTLSSNPKAREAVHPIPRLTEQWILAADDGTTAFRIAKALAGLRGVGEEPLPLRAQLFPVQRKCAQWMNSEAGEKARIHTRQKGRLIDTLQTLLVRRLWLAEKLEMCDKPLDSAAGVTLDDINAFLRDDTMDERIAALLPGLSLCEIPRDVERGAGSGAVPAAFALLKLSLTPDRTLRSLGLLPGNMRLPVPVGILGQLAAGNQDNRAVQTAWRRLRGSGLAPIIPVDNLPGEDSISPHRAAAALLIPLRYGATAALARNVLAPAQPETETETA